MHLPTFAPLAEAPKAYPAEGLCEEGVRGLFFDGPAWQGKPTRVFAWLGVPAAKPGKNLPAMVLVHGGGGTAFARWVRFWNARGYAAIAMDTCGSIPVGKYGDWQRHEHGGPPGWGGFEKADEPVGEQWPYHAVSAVILAHSLLAAEPSVHPKQIGLTGISWGGVLSCLAAAVDRRFAFAAPVYGCSIAHRRGGVWEGKGHLPVSKIERWLELWDPSVHLSKVRCPMLWLTGTNDFAFPMSSLQQSYRLPKSRRTLSVRIELPHLHGVESEEAKELCVFADEQVGGKPPLPRILGQRLDRGTLTVRYSPVTPIVKAELAFTRATGYWEDRKWRTVPAAHDAAAGTVTAKVPPHVTTVMMLLHDARGCVVSGEHCELG